MGVVPVDASGDACGQKVGRVGCTTLIVGLKESDSSPIVPSDLAADPGSRSPGSAKAQVGGTSNGNTYSAPDKAADMGVWKSPLVGKFVGNSPDEVVGLISYHPAG